LGKFSEIDWVHWVKQINPTVVLAVALLSLSFLCLATGFLFYDLAFYAYIPLGAIQVLMVFLGFTVLHDGVHGSLSQKRWLNEIFVGLSWILFVHNPFVWRKIHLTHHAKTNKGKADPDFFVSHKYLGVRILKSFFLIFAYDIYAFRYFRSWKMRAYNVASILTAPLLLYVAFATPFTWPILVIWVIPAYIGVGLLSCANVAFPHHPAKETDKFRNAHNAYVPWVIQLVMLNQNLHLVHHLNPRIPWYEYPEYWKEHEHEFTEKGAPLAVFTSRREPYALVPQAAIEAAHRIRERISVYLN